LIDAQEMEEYGRRTHREVLELIAALSDEISSKGSSVCESTFCSNFNEVNLSCRNT
jgi:hypothetical protein